MRQMITLTINGKKYKAEEGQNLLQVALDNGIEIPHLCYHEKLTPYGGCRLCLVEVSNRKKTTMTTSCTYPAAQGIKVETDTPQVRKARQRVMEMILALAPDSPGIQRQAHDLGIVKPGFTVESDGCIRCGLCVRACGELVGLNTITFACKGAKRKVEPPYDEEAKSCIGCGTCVVICPTGCLKMKDLGEERRIDKWKRVMEMKKCTECSLPYIPQPQVEFIMDKALERPPEDWFQKCPDCR